MLITAGPATTRTGPIWRRPSAVAGAILGILSAAVFFVHAHPPATGDFQPDLALHLGFAERILRGQHLVPHPGFHLCCIATTVLLQTPMWLSSVVVLTAANLASYGLVLQILKQRGAPDDAAWVAWLAFALSVASAIYIPFVSTTFYAGHGTPNIWHNPTWVAVQPFSLAVYAVFTSRRGILSCVMQAGSSDDSRTLQKVGSALLVVSAIFKPSFAFVFLPACCVFVACEAGRLGEKRVAMLRLFALSVPTVAVMAIQGFVAKATLGEPGLLLTLAPFEVWSTRSPNIPYSVFVCVAFPLSTAVVFPGWLRLRETRLAWIIFVIGFLERALFSDTGDRQSHGNFAWPYFTALKLLFIEAASGVLRVELTDQQRRFPAIIVALVLLAHMVSGLTYVLRLITGKGYL